jgi:hypothetical protein
LSVVSDTLPNFPTTWLRAFAALRSRARRIEFRTSQRLEGSYFVNTFSKCVTAFAMLTGSMLASAATETLDYQGNLMTGSQTSWNGTSPVSTPATGTYTAFVDVSTDSTNAWTIGSWGINLNGTQVLSGIGDGITGGGVPVPAIDLEEANGAVVGVAIGWSFMSQGPYSTTQTLSLGQNSGDSWLQYSGCDRLAPGGGGLCGLTLSDTTPGKWTVTGTAAPEIDPATAGSALTLLAGFAAMMRGRKRIAG